MQQIQRIENKAFRTILQVPPYTAVEFLRGEVGSSTMIARDAKNKLSYLKYAMQTSNNDLLRSIVQQKYEKKNTEWIKTTIAYALYESDRYKS